MSAYTVKNLQEIDSSSTNPLVEARFARKYLDSEHLGVSHFRYGPGYRSEMGHHHREQEEAYVILSGSGRVKLGDEIVEVKQWDVVRVAPSTNRAWEAGPEGLEILAVGNDRPEGGDGERVDDFWVG
jgi:mannose-6-phosphate isomerase-like protein (cupin superfamily)